MRAMLLSLFAFFLAAMPASAQAANPAEQFVADRIRAGLTILGDTSLDAAARSHKFEAFLLDATDLKRIALFTLGSSAGSATPVQRDAFVVAFNTYATAVYRSYFQRYSGQSLTVTGSRTIGPDDTIVHTSMIDPDGGRPLAVDFRVRTDGTKPLVIDIGIAGVWLALTQHDDFAAFLARNNGSVDALTAHLLDIAGTYH